MQNTAENQKPQHTPGEWGFAEAECFYERGDIGIHVIREGSADGMLIAVVRDNNMRDMQIANARLIAVSPNLLAACKVALDDSTAGYERHGLSEETIDKLCAAIAKAEGGTA